MQRSEDQGRSWREVPVPASTGCIPTSIAPLADGTLPSTRAAPRMPPSGSESLHDEIEDENRHDDESDVPTEAPVAARAAFRGAPRAPMTLAISADGGRTWPWRRHLDEDDGYGMTHNSEARLDREFSSPSIKPSADGALRMSCTCSRHAIEYMRANEAEALRRAGRVVTQVQVGPA